METQGRADRSINHGATSPDVTSQDCTARYSAAQRDGCAAEIATQGKKLRPDSSCICNVFGSCSRKFSAGNRVFSAWKVRVKGKHGILSLYKSIQNSDYKINEWE